MKEKYLKILKQTYYGLTPKDEKIFSEIMQDDGLGKCKPAFHLYAFIFGWFYLLYRRVVTEAFGVLIFSLMVGYIVAYAKLHPVIVIISIFLTSSLLSGFCYYFLYLNKFAKDLEYCGGYNPDIECMRQKAKPKLSYVIWAVIVIIVVIWPWIYALITGAKLHG